MTWLAQGDQVFKGIGHPGIGRELPASLEMMYVECWRELLKTAILTGIQITLAGFRPLMMPVISIFWDRAFAPKPKVRFAAASHCEFGFRFDRECFAGMRLDEKWFATGYRADLLSTTRIAVKDCSASGAGDVLAILTAYVSASPRAPTLVSVKAIKMLSAAVADIYWAADPRTLSTACVGAFARAKPAKRADAILGVTSAKRGATYLANAIDDHRAILLGSGLHAV